MPVILGIDTGGTYTDSVIVDAVSRQVLCKAKAFTTRQDLLCGIAQSLDRMHYAHPDEIVMVCLSTTLATNAVVEGQSGRVGALLLGRDAAGSLPAVQVRRLRGTLDIKGRILEDISPEEIIAAANAFRGQVDAVAISGFASVRNPVHEARVRQIIQQELDVPVVCAHELSSALGFQERTVTAVLNAALIPNIRALIDSTDLALAQRKIHAPIMIVKGDGSLMRAEYARSRPIETVLSGPAASIVGGLFLSGVSDALLLDMGGTTTDLAEVKNGRVTISAAGATVSGWRTQLRAAEISTFGAGGDSRLHWAPDGQLSIGPQRVLPLCVAGIRNPKLAEELRHYVPPTDYMLFEEQVCECYAFVRPPRYRSMNPQEQQLQNLLKDGPHSLFYLAHHMQKDAEKLGLSALVQQGVLQRCGLTPTDLLHVRGDMTRWNTDAARQGAQLMAERHSLPLADFLQTAFDTVQNRLKETCIQAAADFAHSNISLQDSSARFFLNGHSSLLQTEIRLKRPVVALGAPVAAWLPEVCRSLHTELIIPEHAEVANAVGAAVGQVMVTAEALIRPDQYHKGYIVHSASGSQWFEQLPEAEAWAEQTLRDYVCGLAAQAGGGQLTIDCRAVPTYTPSFTGGQRTFIQTKITATVLGSPQWTEPSKEC